MLLTFFCLKLELWKPKWSSKANLKKLNALESKSIWIAYKFIRELLFIRDSFRKVLRQISR